MVKELSSPKNPELKFLRTLFEKSRVRKQESKFVVEGFREIQKAIIGGYRLDRIFIEEGSEEEIETLGISRQEDFVYSVQKSVFQKITMRSGTEKSIAIGHNKSHNLNDLQLPDNALILVIEAPEKPGNIGALFRTASAAQMDAVIIANPKTDFYNPNSIRASLGTLFMMPTAIARSEEVIAFLNERSFAIATAALRPHAIQYDKYEYKTPCALIMGAESTGLESGWLEASHQHLIIPMSKNVDSLNLSVSAGILMYEAQRKNNRLVKNTIL